MEQPIPDRKDWTWVLERPCENCGFEAGQLDRSGLGARIRANAATWRAILTRGNMVTARPPAAPEASPIWSALEYGCHVRDVYRRFEDRVARMLTEDVPTFADWDQDHAAIEGAYNEQDPGRVSYDLALIAGRTADVVDRIVGDEWDRRGARSDGVSFTIDSLVRYLLHDVSHHAWDAEQGFEALLAGPYADEAGAEDGQPDEGSDQG